MKLKTKNYYDFIYFFIVALTIGFSILYGNILEVNIGEYPQFMVFGGTIPLWAIILIPIGITCLYGYLIYIAYKSGMVNFSRKSLYFIVALASICLYMILIISFKDVTHAFGERAVPNGGPTLNEKIWSILAFYLSILMIYAFYSLLKRIKSSKTCINVLLIAIIGYVFAAIIYSLIAEQDVYKHFFENWLNLFEKNYFLKSWYGIGNVFGHTLYIGTVALIFLSILTKKYWLSIFSILFFPFIIMSMCRATMISTVILYLGMIIYLIYPAFKKSKWLGLTYISVLGVILLLVLLELFVFKNITFVYEGVTHPLKDIFDIIINRTNEQRANIIEMCYQNATLKDFIFGFGYGLSFLLPRTHGGYIYYMHNTYFEYIASGGLVYFIFILSFFAISIYKCLRLRKAKRSLCIFFFVLLLSQIIYGFFESIPIFACDFFGAVFAFFFVLIINNEYSEFINEEYHIVTLNPFGFKCNLDFDVIDDNNEIDSMQIESIKNEVLKMMKRDKVYNLKIALLSNTAEKELLKKQQENKELYERRYKSIYSIDENKYYILSNEL